MVLTPEKKKLALIEAAKIDFDEARAELGRPILGKDGSVNVSLFLARISEAVTRLEAAEKILLAANKIWELISGAL